MGRLRYPRQDGLIEGILHHSVVTVEIGPVVTTAGRMTLASARLPAQRPANPASRTPALSETIDQAARARSTGRLQSGAPGEASPGR